ncbi:hypothetical protein D3C78_298000 [compost metagenome]
MAAWTSAEDQALRQLIGTRSYALIGAALGGRSGAAVHSRAKRLGLQHHGNHGEQHHAAKLNRLQAAMLGALLDAGYTAAEIKAAFGLSVSTQTLGDIGRGTTWRNDHANY